MTVSMFTFLPKVVLHFTWIRNRVFKVNLLSWDVYLIGVHNT